MTETLCDSGAVKIRAGTNASTTITGSPTNMTKFINQAEGDLISDTRCNWIDVYSAMNADFKQVLEGATACMAAIKVINYDMSGFTSRQEALAMVNILWAEYARSVDTLKDDKVITAFGGSLMQ